MEQGNSSSGVQSDPMEARVRSMVSILQMEFDASAGAMFRAFIFALSDIDHLDIAKQMELYSKTVRGKVKLSDLAKLIGSHAGNR